MKRPLYYTFGNHMHWVDMQWLWGYDVLPGSVADMRSLVKSTGARGNVNFDAVGYEKMAAECPGALADLRAMIEDGSVEPVGCSYGQPYGLFLPGESNLRQLTYGIRATTRLLGVRPRTFWEEEFYMFPQLPQVLRRCGYTGACLFFQWTWHTPELPRESASLIHWEGIDGSRIATMPRNALNVHQWPEDFDGLLEQGLVRELPLPAIAQWIELMPSRDWMCRSELLSPRLKELLTDERFDVRPRTCSQLIAELIEHTPADMVVAREYKPDEMWHGLTLGKNADRHPRTMRRVENRLLAAEALASLASIFGRPYQSWDVYPTWELDEAWRELLAAQHHDNHECEGLCGFVAYHQMHKSLSHASEVFDRTLSLLSDRAGTPLLHNGLGWSRSLIRLDPLTGLTNCGRVPPFGFVDLSQTRPARAPQLTEESERMVLSFGDSKAIINTGRRTPTVQLTSPIFVEGVLTPEWAPRLECRVENESVALTPREVSLSSAGCGIVDIDITAAMRHRMRPTTLELAMRGEGLEISISDIGMLAKPDAGLNAAWKFPIDVSFAVSSIRADNPMSVSEVRGSGRVKRKYPSGDWMTSSQWFEDLEGSITAHSFVDLLDKDGSGLLIVHDGSQQFFRTQRGVEVVISAYDSWDEGRFEKRGGIDARVLLLPHGPMRDVDRIKIAREFELESSIKIESIRATQSGLAVGGGMRPEQHPIPTVFAPMEVAGDDTILCHALYRESPKSGEHLPDWVGHEMARRSDGACTHPFVVRLIEWEGASGTAILRFPGAIAAAAKTNVMGEIGKHVGGGEETCWLEPVACPAPEWANGFDIPGGWNEVHVPLKPREIATVMLDLVLGRKEWRDLDAKRKEWATIHRVEGEDGHHA